VTIRVYALGARTWCRYTASFQLFVGGIGGPELVIVVLLFGANQLPKLARASGEAMGEFQKGRDRLESEIRDASRGATPGDVEADVDAVTDSDADAARDTDRLVESDRDAPSA